MNTKVENNEAWIGRIFILFVFLFVLSFANSDSNYQSYSVLVEQVIETDNPAILVKTIDYPDLMVNPGLPDLNFGDSKIDEWTSNRAITLKLQHQRLTFLKIRHRLLQLSVVQLKLFSEEDYPVIS